MNKPDRINKALRNHVQSDYAGLLERTAGLIAEARRLSVRTVNAVMTATYWMIGWHIVEFEQQGEERAEYGQTLLKRLANDLTSRFGRGFSERNLEKYRGFYLAWPISPTASAKSCTSAMGQTVSRLSLKIPQTLSAEFDPRYVAAHFLMPWSAYVRLLSVQNEHARHFYETEALRGGWSVRQLYRQINSQFYERTALSRNRAAMLKNGGKSVPADAVTPEEEIKDPLVLEFLGLKDEYSETDMEEALLRHLESFLLELGGDFAFIGRQRRLRIDDEWYRVDLLFFHRRLRCMVVIDLKLGKFTHADAGQMHLYLNYAREHWTRPDENPPVGLILCAQKGASLANKVLAAEYKTALPDEKQLAAELDRVRAKQEPFASKRSKLAKKGRLK